MHRLRAMVSLSTTQLESRPVPREKAQAEVLSPSPTAGASNLTVLLDPDIDSPQVRYGIEQLLRVIGYRSVFVRHGHAMIYAGADDPAGGRAAVRLAIEPTSHAHEHRPRVVENGGIPMVCWGESPGVPVDGNRIQFDIVRSTSFWLTLEGERDVAQRDEHGRVLGPDSLLGTCGLLNVPPIHRYADLLGDLLRERGVEVRPMPRWPNGANYAVALTHDVDLPERPARGRVLLGELWHGGTRSRREAYWDLRSTLRSRGMYDSCLAPATRRPEWDFPLICELERRHNLRSAFYFSVVHRDAGDRCDVTYDVRQRRYRRLFRRLRTGGWEVGLHASYLTRLGTPTVAGQVQTLAAAGADPIAGVRHHYLQIDRTDPIRSLLEHSDAGLMYDTSIGFNDCAGLRAGIALPYRPYDSGRMEARVFVELPMTLADMHLPREDEAAAITVVSDHLDCVRSLGGLAVLNWHVGHWYTDPAWRAAYVAVCEMLSGDAEAWIATPREIARWWLHGEVAPGA